MVFDRSTLSKISCSGALTLLYHSLSIYSNKYKQNTGPPCQRFTPLLSVLHQEAKEEKEGNNNNTIDFEVVHVSSDDSASQCHEYMQKKHGNWLRIPFDAPLRQALKKKYGVFAAKEQQLQDLADTKRRNGIPTLVIIGKDGEEKVMLDVGDPNVIKEMESQGTSYLSQWQEYKW